jgi:hypothetical protein
VVDNSGKAGVTCLRVGTANSLKLTFKSHFVALLLLSFFRWCPFSFTMSSSSSSNKQSSTFVTLVDSDKDDSLQHAKIVTLQHPSSSSSSIAEKQHFLQTPHNNNVLLELQSVSRPFGGSFVVGSRLISNNNGGIHMVTPVDPLFLALGYLEKQTTTTTTTTTTTRNVGNPWISFFMITFPRPL